LPGEPLALVQGLIEKAGKNWVRMITEMSKYVVPLAADVSGRVRAACQGTDVIVHSFLLTQAGYEAAKELGVLDISAQLFPVFAATHEFPSPVFPDLPLGDSYRRISHHLTTLTFWRGGQLLYWWVRRSHPQLPALTGWPFDRRNVRRSPVLYAFSPSVVPQPADWPAEAQVTGYWFLDNLVGWQPPEPLLSFLDDGPEPACIALGSSTGATASRVGNLAIEALCVTGQRGIVVGRNLDLEDPPDHVLVVDYAPYGWLFPRMTCVVHHGGAGTTGQALRVGVPSIVVPFTSDQPFWGRRIHALGAGPHPIPAQRLSGPTLAAALGEVIRNPEIRFRARELGERIRAEDGVATAIGTIVHHSKGAA
jgi:sterol 3beta-glucosyltransferase